MDDLADQAQIAGLKASLEVPAKDYLKAMRIRRLIQEAFAKLFAEWTRWWRPGARARRRWDKPLGPARTPPGRSRRPDSGDHPGRQPGGPARAGAALRLRRQLPVALQVVGAPFSENLLLAIGKEFQARTDWHKRRPPGV